MKILVKQLFILAVLWSVSFAQQQYRPLTKAERRDFVRAADAVKIASEAGNTAAVLRFGPGIVEKYESIMLDPASSNLRPLYDTIKGIVDNIELRVAIDSFDVGIGKLVKGGDYYLALKRYDEYFDYLAEQGSDTAKAAAHRLIYQDCVLKYFDGGFEKLKELSLLRNVSAELLDSLRHIVETSYSGVFVGMMSTNSIEDLFNFKRDYPGLYTKEIEDLITNFKAKWRLSLKRWPSVDKIEQYYVVFPDKDRMIDSVYQRLLYADFRKNLDVITASKYLSCFPAGMYSQEVRTFIDIQQEQQRIAQLQALKELQAAQTQER